jgi:hypothetical protein
MYVPSIAWIDVTPLKVSPLALNNNRWPDAAAIRTDSFKDRDQFTVAIFNLIRHLLASLNQGRYSGANSKLNTLFIHVVDILTWNVVLLDDFLQHLEVLSHNCGIETLSTAPFEWRCPLDLEVRVASDELFWPRFSNWFATYVARMVS